MRESLKRRVEEQRHSTKHDIDSDRKASSKHDLRHIKSTLDRHLWFDHFSYERPSANNRNGGPRWIQDERR